MPLDDSTPAAGTPLRSAFGSQANVDAKMDSANRSVKSPSRPAVQFGQPSPMRNSLFDSDAALFNPLRGPSKKKTVGGASKTYVQQASQSQAHHASRAYISTNAADDWQDPGFQAAVSNLQTEMQRPQRTIIEIPRNKPTYDVLPPPRPMFNSIGAQAGLAHQDRAASDSEDSNFDPNAALKTANDAFGAPDPTMYMDADRANENMKQLMVGAFDDAPDEPQVPLKHRASPKKSTSESTKSKSLVDKLSDLNIAEPQPETSDDDDDGTVEGMAVKLLPHQVEGVSWMLEKESRKKKNGFVSRGGILADDMGLGKTIQSVALMLLNPRPPLDAKKEDHKHKLPKDSVGKSTLIVAPLALIRQWESEIKTKIEKDYALKVYVHHGSSRTKSPALLKQYDVVITTYQILASEHAASDMYRPDSRVGCFGVHWYRIILDEAHSIKNRNAKSTLACCDLDSWSRWCLTGTPMQNNLDELQSLIRFLRIKPYCELSQWKCYITQPMKSGRGGVAMQRLRVFLQAIMKRRTKDILKKEGALNFGGKTDSDRAGGMQIVKREIINVDCVFTPQEQHFYDQLADRAKKRLDDMLIDGGKTDYIGALVLLLRLRQACNHPALVNMAASKSGLDIKDLEIATPKPSRNADAEVDALADLFGGVAVSKRVCEICGLKLESSDISQDSRSLCSDCESGMSVISDKFEAAQPPKLAQRARQRVLADSEDEDDDSVAIPSTPKAKTSSRPGSESSTKIDRILHILNREGPQHKTIIFSQFTSMLDLIQPHLEQRFVRYDGSMRPDEREAALNSLRNNPKTRVLLCSLKCGSLGLNLTAASRVIIVEPFWNPFVEEQAIDRVHRLNQTIDVKVYRLTIAETVEERILALQERKRELARAAIEGDGKGAGKLSMEDMLNLFKSGDHSAEVMRANKEFASKFGNEPRLIDGPNSSPKKSVQQGQDRTSAGQQRRPENQIYGRRW